MEYEKGGRSRGYALAARSQRSPGNREKITDRGSDNPEQPSQFYEVALERTEDVSVI
jgi:hypothetical protein